MAAAILGAESSSWGANVSYGLSPHCLCQRRTLEPSSGDGTMQGRRERFQEKLEKEDGRRARLTNSNEPNSGYEGASTLPVLSHATRDSKITE